jgi:hypothetical protein
MNIDKVNLIPPAAPSVWEAPQSPQQDFSYFVHDITQQSPSRPSITRQRPSAIQIHEEPYIHPSKWAIVRQMMRAGVFKRVDAFLNQCSELGELIEASSPYHS